MLTQYPNILPQLICAHLAGDFLLQNHWMQRKSESDFVCTVHVFFYFLPFCILPWLGWPVVAAIWFEHWIQDRFGLAKRWMKTFEQTTPEMWPAGPLCVDQAMHITWIWLVWKLLL